MLHRTYEYPTPFRRCFHPVLTFCLRMKWVFGLAISAALAVWLPAESLKAKSTPQKPAHSTAKSSSASHKSKTSARTHRRSTRRRVAHAGPAYQTHPDTARYAEIQKALADRGYFKGQVDGKWGDDSVDALKRFQADQKLDTDGKINSLSLIGLGLGPKHDTSLSPPSLPAAGPSPGGSPPSSSSAPEQTAPPPATPPT